MSLLIRSSAALLLCLSLPLAAAPAPLHGQFLPPDDLTLRDSVPQQQQLLQVTEYSVVIGSQRQSNQQPIPVTSPVWVRLKGKPLNKGATISQVLVNVVVNAFHAMPHGGRCRISACERSREGGRSVEVPVQDTGVGIPQQDLQRVFEPFYTTKSGGTGLGLAIAYRIMQDHGGSIHLSSSPGSGTTMVLRFPVSARHPQPTEVG